MFFSVRLPSSAGAVLISDSSTTVVFNEDAFSRLLATAEFSVTSEMFDSIEAIESASRDVNIFFAGVVAALCFVRD
jgi:hypothetical protein